MAVTLLNMPTGSQPKPGPFASAVSDEIRLAMTRRRINGVQLAVKVGRSQAYISTRLRNEMSFTVHDIETICEALGEDPLRLLTRAILARRKP